MLQPENKTEILAIGMSVLNDAALIVNISRNYKEMLEGITRHFKALMPIDYAWLLVNDGHKLRNAARKDGNGKITDSTMAVFDIDIVNEVIEKEVNEKIDDLDLIKNNGFPGKMKSAIICPLDRGSEAMGCLIIGSKKKKSYRKEDATFIFLLGLQLSVALRNIKLQADLLSRNRELNLIFSNIDEGLILLDGDINVSAFNPPINEKFFQEHELETGINFADFLIKNKDSYSIGVWINQVKKLKESAKSDFPVVFDLFEENEESPMVMRIEINLINTEEYDRGMLVLLRDMREMQKAEDLRRNLTSMLVHDLRSPLGIINWNLEMLLDGLLGTINNKQKNILNGSIANSQELLDMIDSLLDIDRLETGAMMLNYEKVNVKDMVYSIVERMSFLSQQVGISMRVDFPKDFPLVNADSSLIHRILFNLMFNAAKYSPMDSIVIISGEHDKSTNRIIIGVKDKGPGIPEKYHKTIFDKYVQADARDKGQIKSKGLGLTFCQLAVDAHGGRIWVESVEEEGSLFKFDLSCSDDSSG